ncbi:serine hydrolase domain-containing protein [Xenorhabdus taiwanensis]|uniref:Serine hydrolase domain-containing protein n=1 Tax=Xenorhabdus taiwanensis TaxID=3085177 RepID=A0ABN7C3B9_9GAMM|nr:serine hydrolase domain-containing protein [Xenorhabdus sp. TCT-1]
MINAAHAYKRCFLITVWLIVWSTGISAHATAMIKSEQIADELARRWNVNQIPTAGLSIVTDGQVVAMRLGKAEKGVFELASTSKAFTGLLIALLEKEGVLNRQDLLIRWLPELAEYPQMGYSEIKIQDLLFHTSGIGEATLALLQPDTSPDALSHLPLLLQKVPLFYPTGTQEEYATLNYSLLGLVAERATGKPFAALMQERIFLPLGMNSTRVESSIETAHVVTENIAPIPQYKISFTMARPYDAPRYWQNTPAGYVLSTPQDMALWLQFLLRRLPPQNGNPTITALYTALEQAQRPYGGNSNHGYAYGWDVETDQTTYWSHPGQNPNSTAYVAFDPQIGVGIALLGNSNSPQVIELGLSVFQYLRGRVAHLLPEQLPVDINDKIATVAAIIFWSGGILCVLVMPYKRKKRIEQEIRKNCQKASGKQFVMVSVTLNALLIAMIMVTPSLLMGWNWPTLLVWGPLSLPVAAAGLIFLVNAINLLFFFPVRFRH